jgi:hypothetical protein
MVCRLFFISSMIRSVIGECVMVYCSKCGTKNEETADYCVKCNARLRVLRKEDWEKRIEEEAKEFGRRAEIWGQQFGKHAENECFGLPNGGLVFGLVIGIVIILVGVLALAGIEFWRSFWAIIITAFGVLIATGALYSLTRKH